MKLLPVTKHDIDLLKVAARDSTKHRSRIIMHEDHNDPMQEMVIAIQKDSYIRTHRHPIGKDESYHIIDGAMLVFIYDDDGKRIDVLVLSHKYKRDDLICRIDGGVWHQPVATTEFAVYHETYPGPWEKDKDVEYAPWAIKEAA